MYLFMERYAILRLSDLKVCTFMTFMNFSKSIRQIYIVLLFIVNLKSRIHV